MEEKNINPVKYTDKEAEYRGNLYQKLTSAKNQRDNKHIEFDDADYLTFYDGNAKAANSYIRPKNEEEDTRIYNRSTNFKDCFERDRFSGTQGEAPHLWDCDFGTATIYKEDCWADAGNSTASLSNYADIPSEWK